MFTDRDGKYQLLALAESGFDPLSRTTRFMLPEVLRDESQGLSPDGEFLQRRDRSAAALLGADPRRRTDRRGGAPGADPSFRDAMVMGTVIAKDDLAGRTFARTAGGAPATWVRESAPRGQAAAERYFARGGVLIASFPPGATVWLAGKPAGSTPVLVPDLETGTDLALALEHPGFLRKESTEKATLAPTGVRRVEVALDPSAPEAPEAEEAWFADGEGAKLTVSQEAKVEWTSPDGKSKSSPELILRCASGEKEVYLYSAHGFGAQEGDLFIRFENEPKPKKYWGARSQNGLSLFFTGFWGKGTDGVIKALLQHKTMTLSVKPKKKEPLPELTFDLRGLDTALSDWLKACPLKK